MKSRCLKFLYAFYGKIAIEFVLSDKFSNQRKEDRKKLLHVSDRTMSFPIAKRRAFQRDRCGFATEHPIPILLVLLYIYIYCFFWFFSSFFLQEGAGSNALNAFVEIHFDK